MTSEVSNPVATPTGEPEKIVSANPVDSGTISTAGQRPESESKPNKVEEGIVMMVEQDAVATTKDLSDSSDVPDLTPVLTANQAVVNTMESQLNQVQKSLVATEGSSEELEQESIIPQQNKATTAEKIDTPTNILATEAETDSKEEESAPIAAEKDSVAIGEASESTLSQTKASETSNTPVIEPQSPPLSATPSPVAIDINAAISFDTDDFITSPHGNNAIVERSPGGRYVRFMEKLGSGASKDVYRAYDTQEGIEVAWNVVHLAGVPRNERNRIVNEVQLLERLHHHNIISFHGSWVNREKQQVNFVTEILSSGTLKSFITKVQVIRWKIAKRWATQILKGLEYLHSQEPPVIHRDLKCENIFINGTSGDLRIGDLGLSTVHRNGKQLSVLGTPEFMAPDMYEEENSYDEKVDVYAFGMCMLEMFTKEIPYRECSNPAQIYKRVSRGDPPKSLNRIQSKQARQFIELCLGYMDKNEKYIRPSATELLAHEFLQSHPNDDEEVKVHPPMQERTIRETNSNTSSPSMKALPLKDRVSPASSSSQPVQTETSQSLSSSSRHKHIRSISLEDDESDRFDEMPDSEVNIRKVKVMVGRGLELKEEDGPARRHERKPSSGSIDASSASVGSSGAKPVGESNAQSGGFANEPSGLSSQPAHPAMHYLVAAAVIENEYSNARPYQDDILKLVVTLPVEGQTQNVQFDFHLVEDDPIQVAKEMVAELGIPQGAVLEISETISGLARAARVNQDKYLARQQQSQGHVRSSSQAGLSSVSSLSSIQNATNSEIRQGMVQGHVRSSSQAGLASVSSLTGMQNAANSEIQQGMVQQSQPIGQVQNQGMMPSTSHQSLSQQMVQAHPQASGHVHQPLHQQAVPVPDQQPVQMHSQQIQMQPQHVILQETNIPDKSSEVSSQQTSYSQQPIQMNAQLQSQQVTPPATNPQTENSSSHVPILNQHQQSVPLNPVHTSAEPNGHSARQQYDNSVPLSAPISVRQASPASGHQVPAPFSGQMQMQTSGQVRQGIPVQTTGGQQDSGGSHVIQQQPLSMPTQHSNIVQQPPQQVHIAPNAGQNQAHGNAVTPQQVPAASLKPQPPLGQMQQQQATVMQQQPLHRQPSPLQPGHQIPENPQQVVSAVGHPGRVESSGGLSQDSQSHAVAAQLQEKHPDNLDQQQASTDATTSKSSQDEQVNGVYEALSMDRQRLLESFDPADEELAAELRKLDQDFKKTVMRAKKVFDSRMDNMTRLQHQREAEHQKTLNEHEKQRVDFEKRLQQEEIEQNRRIKLLQKEWERKREEFRQTQQNEADISFESSPHVQENMMPMNPSGNDGSRP
jgi:WNK lysine deficient protein kinase